MNRANLISGLSIIFLIFSISFVSPDIFPVRQEIHINEQELRIDDIKTGSGYIGDLILSEGEMKDISGQNIDLSRQEDGTIITFLSEDSYIEINGNRIHSIAPVAAKVWDDNEGEFVEINSREILSVLHEFPDNSRTKIRNSFLKLNNDGEIIACDFFVSYPGGDEPPVFNLGEFGQVSTTSGLRINLREDGILRTSVDRSTSLGSLIQEDTDPQLTIGNNRLVLLEGKKGVWIEKQGETLRVIPDPAQIYQVGRQTTFLPGRLISTNQNEMTKPMFALLDSKTGMTNLVFGTAVQYSVEEDPANPENPNFDSEKFGYIMEKPGAYEIYREGRFMAFPLEGRMHGGALISGGRITQLFERTSAELNGFNLNVGLQDNLDIHYQNPNEQIHENLQGNHFFQGEDTIYLTGSDIYAKIYDGEITPSMNVNNPSGRLGFSVGDNEGMPGEITIATSDSLIAGTAPSLDISLGGNSRIENGQWNFFSNGETLSFSPSGPEDGEYNGHEVVERFREFPNTPMDLYEDPENQGSYISWSQLKARGEDYSEPPFAGYGFEVAGTLELVLDEEGDFISPEFAEIYTREETTIDFASGEKERMERERGFAESSTIKFTDDYGNEFSYGLESTKTNFIDSAGNTLLQSEEEVYSLDGESVRFLETKTHLKEQPDYQELSEIIAAYGMYQTTIPFILNPIGSDSLHRTVSTSTRIQGELDLLLFANNVPLEEAWIALEQGGGHTIWTDIGQGEQKTRINTDFEALSNVLQTAKVHSDSLERIRFYHLHPRKASHMGEILSNSNYYHSNHLIETPSGSQLYSKPDGDIIVALRNLWDVIQISPELAPRVEEHVITPSGRYTIRFNDIADFVSEPDDYLQKVHEEAQRYHIATVDAKRKARYIERNRPEFARLNSEWAASRSNELFTIEFVSKEDLLRGEEPERFIVR
jgi:hypothetical protein